MNLAQFTDWSISQGSVAKYNDGQFKGECVSLVNQYCYRVLGIPANAWGHAKDWATNPITLSFFNKVDQIQAGDVLVYGATKGNPYGHIEIALGEGRALGQNRNLDGRVRTAGVLGGYIAILRSKQGEPMERKASYEFLANASQVVLGRPIPVTREWYEKSAEKNMTEKQVYEMWAGSEEARNFRFKAWDYDRLSKDVLSKTAVIDYINKNLK